jgi:hypothetical protein
MNIFLLWLIIQFNIVGRIDDCLLLKICMKGIDINDYSKKIWRKSFKNKRRNL